MESDDIIDLKQPCKVCGLRKAMIKAGFQYCIECGTQTDANPQLDFTQEYNPTITHLTTIRTKSKNLKLGEIWSTWHAHNFILLGLTRELVDMGVSENILKVTVFKLWGKFLKLNKIAFFEKKFCARPRLPFGFQNRDVEFLYDIRKPKKPKNKKRSTNIQNLSELKGFALAKKKALLIRREYQKLLNTQVSTCPVSQTLADLKEAPSSKPSTITFTKRTIKLLRSKLSQNTIDKHRKEGFCGPGCRCLQFKSSRFWQRKNKLTITNLYAILILSLRIIEYDIQVGDILRWCREGHISYGSFEHFFPEDMVFKKNDKKFVIYKANLSHAGMRNNVNMIAKYLKLDQILPSDIKSLIRRYIVELELPSELYDFIIRLMSTVEPLPCYTPKKNGTLPNYEGIAMSYIIVSLKILFGLDDNAENSISNSAQEINDRLSFQREKKSFPRDLHSLKNENKKSSGNRRLFVWKDWMQYIEYRKICISEYHYPTRIQSKLDDYDAPDLYFHQNQMEKKHDIEEYKTRNVTNIFIKSILDRVEDEYDFKKESFPIFGCSLYPMASGVENLLTWNFSLSVPKFNKDILEEDFTYYDLSYALNPKKITYSLSKLGINLQIIDNRNILVDPKLMQRKKRKNLMNDGNTIEVLDCSLEKWLDILETEDIREIMEEIQHNRMLEDKIITFNVTANNDFRIEEEVKNHIKLMVCYKNYWCRHYYYFLKTFSISTFDLELKKHFPKSFSWLLRQCATICEMENNHLYLEVCRLEKALLKTDIFKENNL